MIDEPVENVVDQIEHMTDKELEPLYWVLEDALCDNRRARAMAVYQLFCAVAKLRRGLLCKGLQKTQIARLKEIAYELIDKETCVYKHSIEFKLPLSPKPLPFLNEKALEDYLSNNIHVLEAALGEPLRLVGTQVPTNFDYACDLVVEGAYFYPIELKIGQSKHGVVSQIEKYCYYFYRKLRYDRYKPIQGVVIANGADAYSINEIRKSGHLLFDIQPVGRTDISLVKI